MSQVFDPQTTPVLDSATLDQLLALDDGATGLLQEMVEIYRQDMPDRLKALDVTLEGVGDFQEASEVAHALKGAASTMGAPRARAVAALMEGGGRKSELSLERMRELSLELRACYEESLAGLETFLASRQS